MCKFVYFLNQRNHHNYTNLSENYVNYGSKPGILVVDKLQKMETQVYKKNILAEVNCHHHQHLTYTCLQRVKKWEHENGMDSRELELYLTFLTVYISCYKFEVNRAKGCRKLSNFNSKSVKTTHFLTTALSYNKSPTHTCANCQKRDLFLFE